MLACLTGKIEHHLLPVTEVNIESKSSESVCCHRNTFSAATQRANTDVSFPNSPALMLAPLSGKIQQDWTDIESKLVVTSTATGAQRDGGAQMSAPQTDRYWCRVCVVPKVLNRDRLPKAAVCFEERRICHLTNEPALLLFSSCIGGWGALPTCILPSIFSAFASSLFFSVWFFHPGIKITSFPQMAARIIPAPTVRHEIGCQISAVTTGLHTICHYCAFMNHIYQSTFHVFLFGSLLALLSIDTSTM